MPDWENRFPEVFADWAVDYAPVHAHFVLGPPPIPLISRVHLLARTGGRVVVCASDNGWRFLPGGTREPGETVEQTVDRELLEEAGARRVGSLSWLGAHRTTSRAEHPYRPHLPHPIAYWAIGIADVVVDAEPTNPPDGELVTDVVTLPPEQAVVYLREHDPVHAGIVALGDAMGLIGHPAG